jgi:PKD repeat protein
MKMGWVYRFAMLAVVAGALAVCTPSASALIVKEPNGTVVSIALRSGINPTSVPGSIASGHAARGTSGFSTADNLSYHGGAVVRSVAPYLIFWIPSGDTTLSSASQALIQRYFTDNAADSGGSQNVYGVDRQFTDGAGFADYKQTFSASQSFADTQSYPTTGNCTVTSGTFPTCLTDAQIRTEVKRVIAANGWPEDGTSSSDLAANAPLYFVILPPDVNECTNSTQCASNRFCAYHSDLVDGSTGNFVLYSLLPTLLASSNPKGCQVDGNAQVQKPNGDQVGDVTIKYTSHEFSETITDPIFNSSGGVGWWNTSSGQEDGDQCNFSGAYNPSQDSNPNAFTPTLGGAAAAGTLFNQLINGNQYYTQSEWSNGDGNCKLRPSAGTMLARFTTPSSPQALGTTWTFNPSASSSSNGYSSVSWSFGDGTTSFDKSGSGPSAVSHDYATAGNYTVTLTLVDPMGNLAMTSHVITAGSPPAAAFSSSPAQPVPGSQVSFDGTGSTDPNAGVTITSYTWTFGDGTNGTGAMTNHTYATDGTYTVALKVTDSIGLTNTVTHTITVDEDPTAAFTVSSAHPPVGQVVSFDGSGSSDADGSIASYSWTFGDGATGTGSNPSHSYSSPGTYTVSLTVIDSSGRRDSISQQLTVGAPPTAAFSFSPPQAGPNSPVSFDGSSSSDPDSGVTITAYAWNFGDGTTGSGATTSHSYANPGTYTVTLTVTNSLGLTSAPVTHQVAIVDESPTASFTVNTPSVATGQTAAFNAVASSDPDGSIVTYAWNFGDGTTGLGASPTHAYTKPGVYTVTLGVVDSSGHMSTTAHTITVVKAKITKTSVRHKRSKGATLLVTTNAPGKVSAAHKSGRLMAPGTVSLKFKLSTSQLRTLASKGKLTIKVKITFSPTAGSPSTTTLTIRF